MISTQGIQEMISAVSSFLGIIGWFIILNMISLILKDIGATSTSCSWFSFDFYKNFFLIYSFLYSIWPIHIKKTACLHLVYRCILNMESRTFIYLYVCLSISLRDFVSRSHLAVECQSFCSFLHTTLSPHRHDSLLERIANISIYEGYISFG